MHADLHHEDRLQDAADGARQDRAEREVQAFLSGCEKPHLHDAGYLPHDESDHCDGSELVWVKSESTIRTARKQHRAHGGGVIERGERYREERRVEIPDGPGVLWRGINRHRMPRA